jgi:hypothetical protein
MRLLLNKLSADPELLLRRFCLISFKKGFDEDVLHV